MRRVLRFAVTALVVLAASLAFGGGSASAGRVDPPGHQGANHCILFFTGVDLNELLGSRSSSITISPARKTSLPESTGARLLRGSRRTGSTASTRRTTCRHVRSRSTTSSRSSR